MKIGITGHQKRKGADWDWARTNIEAILAEADQPIEGWTSLAVGADQMFANELLRAQGHLMVVIPKINYEAEFKSEEGLNEYRRLLNRSQQIVQLDNADPQSAFFDASKVIVESCELLIAVWDERPSRGRGGTADVVKYAKDRGKKVVILNLILKVAKWH